MRPLGSMLRRWPWTLAAGAFAVAVLLGEAALACGLASPSVLPAAWQAAVIRSVLWTITKLIRP